MSTFTIELRKVVEITGGNIGLDSYPIFDEAYRETLNGKIIDHFMFDEIGHETIELFVHQMKVKMQEIMPAYNQMYESQRIKFDPLSTIDVRTLTTGSAESLANSTAKTTSDSDSSSTVTATKSGTSATESVNDALSRTVTSETPSVRLSGDADYASSATDTTGRSSGTSSATESGNEETEGGVTSRTVGGEEASQSARDSTSSDSRVTGYSGVASDLIMRFREAIINVDVMIINDLKPLFMQVWNNGNEYTDPATFSMFRGWYY